MKLSEIGCFEADELVARVNEERNKIARRAANELGYHGIKGTQLAKTLAEMELLPLNFADVKRYQRSKEKIRPSATSAWLALLCVICTATSIHVGLQASRVEIPDFWMILVTAIAGVGALASGIGTVANFRVWKWYSIEISRYKEAIPEHVVRRALEVKKKLPQVEFYVSYLAAGDLYDPDPFLWVELGAEWYYLDVWDEKFSA